ncbi:hypothetical protein L195_g057471 [Trifolium pratense]|uniref:Uncharacterized protein n=1 Tax=Trifolium pratense TaxID=57577 RepID=A0A2K3KW55_TRIPR|nr:hypothetical protein L195_g057471 [Trifolium pratense]
MGRTFAFRVNWQSHWKQCSVLACLDSKFMCLIITSLIDINLQLNVGGNSFVNFIDNQDCHDEIQSIARFRTHSETLPSITEGVSATSEHDPEFYQTVTPTKLPPTPHIQ